MSSQIQTQPVVCDQCGGKLDLETTQTLTECRWCGVVLLKVDWNEEGSTTIANLGLRVEQVEEETAALIEERDQEKQNRITVAIALTGFMILFLVFAYFYGGYQKRQEAERRAAMEDAVDETWDWMMDEAMRKSKSQQNRNPKHSSN